MKGEHAPQSAESTGKPLSLRVEREVSIDGRTIRTLVEVETASVSLGDAVSAIAPLFPTS